ncbi:transcriptional regulator, TetR domain protein [Bordetella bronchiseptica E010]|nr:transcriptional regulator, TetR domain protein [Bordetella bronchiseptica E010]
MNELKSTSTREIILETAEQLFAQQGHDGTSMRQITSAPRHPGKPGCAWDRCAGLARKDTGCVPRRYSARRKRTDLFSATGKSFLYPKQ